MTLKDSSPTRWKAMPDKQLVRIQGLPNLVDPNVHDVVRVKGGQMTQGPGRAKQFWQPFFSGFPSFRPGGFIRSWFGSPAVGPVNQDRSFGNVIVTPELALKLSAVWACVGRYQNTVSTLPLNLLKGAAGNSAEPFRTHPLYRILHDQPNSQQSSTTFWKAFIGQLMSWGIAAAVVLKVGNKVVGLKPILSAYLTVYFDGNERLRYAYAPPGGPQLAQDFAAEELFVVLDRTMDGYSPMSRITYGANSLGVAISADRAANLAFKNGLRTSGILSIAAWLKPEQREAYRQKVNEFVGTGTGDGNDKQFGVFVAENATKFEAINIKPMDVELLDSRKFSVEDTCRWYDIPPVLIGHSAEGQTMWGSGIEQIILGWLKLGLAPMLRSIEQEIWRQLLTEQEKAAGVFAEFNLEGLLRGDSAARASFYSTMTQNGIYTRAEARARESLPPIEGSDKLTVQSNLTPLADLGNNPANDGQQVRNALRAFLGLENHDAPEEKNPRL